MMTYAYNQRMHMTEHDPLANDTFTARRFYAAWSRFWDLSAPVLIEKSPPNVLKFRFLEKVFGRERTHLVVLVRHPIAAASYRYRQKDQGGILVADCFNLAIKHWAAIYTTLLEDLAVLGQDRVLLIQYEHLVGYGLSIDDAMSRTQVCPSVSVCACVCGGEGGE